MRLVFLGSTEVTNRTAELLLQRGHEIVIIEPDRERIKEVSDSLDVSFLHGDGSKPHILREADPEHTDILFCITDNDQKNILASLVGKSLGYERVVTTIRDGEYEPICQELGISDMLMPVRTISQYLADLARGVDVLELSTFVKGEARFFSFVIRDEELDSVEKLELPDDSRAICLYREGRFALTDPETSLQRDDEVVVLTHSRHLADLQKRWKPNHANASD